MYQFQYYINNLKLNGFWVNEIKRSGILNNNQKLDLNNAIQNIGFMILLLLHTLYSFIFHYLSSI